KKNPILNLIIAFFFTLSYSYNRANRGFIIILKTHPGTQITNKTINLPRPTSSMYTIIRNHSPLRMGI
ncbi:MAG: hypothetical protein KAQ69_08460, partial [Spirochaetales bacterium]|nr:hypothetical protein [Spirochaetales bacterium]